MPETPQSFPDLRVLLVEDNPVNQRVAQLMLQGLGVTVSTAGDGIEALAKLEGDEFDIILMDCQMPQLDGFATTERIRDRSDEKALLPIIALTANAMNGDRERCLEAGMDDYLSKPFSKTALAEALQRVLQSAGST